MLRAVGAAVAADPTLADAVAWAEPAAPQTEDLAVDGSPHVRGAVVTITLVYSSTTPLRSASG